MNEMQIFENPEFGEIRTMEIDSVVWFCATDVAKVLGYKNPNDAISKHCKGVAKRDTLTNGGVQKMAFINEPDVYRLIAHSKLPKAEAFEKWVFEEVLPTIRKTGSYSIVQKQDSYQIDDPIERAKRWIEEQEERNRLAMEVKTLEPKAKFCDSMINCKDLISTTVIAKDYGKSAKWLNKWLHEQGVQFKQGNTWVLYQKYSENGYTGTKQNPYNGKDGEMHGSVQTYWTPKGKRFIYELLKANGIVPNTERTEVFEEPELFPEVSNHDGQ